MSGISEPLTEEEFEGHKSVFFKDPITSASDARDGPYCIPFFCAFQPMPLEIEHAKRTGNADLLKKMEDVEREYNFFRDALYLVDYISYGTRRNLRNEFVALINPKTKRIENWERILLEKDWWTKKLGKGFKGYKRELIFSHLHDYTSSRSKEVREEDDFRE